MNFIEGTKQKEVPGVLRTFPTETFVRRSVSKVIALFMTTKRTETKS